MASGSVALIVFGACALLVSGLAATAAIYFLLRLERPRAHRVARATLILPLTGRAPELQRLVESLENQTLRARRLMISVESADDPAYAAAQHAAASSRIEIEVLLAGLGEACAQKCFNQLAALRRIDDGDDAVILLDADIAPERWWLSAMVSPIVDGTADIVTGYRWQMPSTSAFGANLIASIDRAIAVLPRLRRARGVWGGSLALSRQSCDALALDRLLARTLSDDCSIGDAAAMRGLQVLTRRALLVPTPIGTGLREAWRFGRRQSQIIRIYRPGLFALGFVSISARLLAWPVLLWGAASHDPAAWGILLVLAGLALASFVAQHMIARRLGFADRASVTAAQGLLALAKPLVDAFYWSMLAAAFWPRRMRWGHVTYRIDGRNDIAVERRSPW